MISENDKKLVQDAKQCSNCLEWHKHCKAECCSIIYLNISQDQYNKHNDYIDIKKPLLPNDIWYYKLRGIRYIHGIMRIPKLHCKYLGNQLVYLRKCNLLLDNYKCKGHPDKKPNLCKSLTLETSKTNNSRWVLTPNCLFKYKLKSENYG